jgi:ANTAR domain.
MKQHGERISTVSMALPDDDPSVDEDAEMARLIEQNARLEETNAQLLEKTRQLETALVSRIVIEQAKGVLRARHGLDVTTAFEVLRRGARSNQLRVHDLATRVVEEPDTPAEVSKYLP